MQHFHGHGQIVDVRALIAQQAGREHHQQGPQAFAARFKNVQGHGPHGFGQAVGGAFQGRVDGRQFQGEACFEKNVCHGSQQVE